MTDPTLDAIIAGKPLDVFGDVCPPGYRFCGISCPMNEAARCEHCGSDDHDILPTECGHGVKGYRLETWPGFKSPLFKDLP
jgi:hypothetical protein